MKLYQISFETKYEVIATMTVEADSAKEAKAYGKDHKKDLPDVLNCKHRIKISISPINK